MNERRFDLNIPDPVESRRTTSGRLVRIIYSLGVLSIGIFLSWHFGKWVIFLDGPGIITAPRYLISKSFVSQVISLDVKPGTIVKKGQIIGQIRSFDVDTYITNLVKILVDQYAVDSALRVRLSVSANTLESAKQRLRAVQDMVQQLESGPKEAASLLYRSDIFREQAAAELAIARSSAELDEATQQRQRLADAQKVLEDRLAMFREEYNDGLLSAPVSGIVGAKIADIGETIIPGNAIIEIFDERTRYIEWNIPPSRLIDPVLGSLVFINDGATVSEGQVTKVLMLSGNFAGTKGSVFSPTEYGQVARVITNDPKAMQNLNTRVNVRMNYLSYMNFIARYVGWI